ncbi:UNVERIFIED_CONTAM: Villin-3 [Sesamum radiatum]|uniref:Villin-3 n=1 Tax=Sesamum radiatum TaxID=300843 RepID=A0AAW2N9F3_SESRA
MSSSAKSLEPAFQGAGQKVGTEIWRIENFQPVPLPKSDYGKFYSGDSYIILQTSPGKGGGYLYDIHFWLGKDTSQDEAGTAAIKTVELDAILGGRAVQYRELQGHESDKFLSYFKPCIIPLEGGVASGFKKPEEEEFETRLYICKGKRVVRLKQDFVASQNRPKSTHITRLIQGYETHSFKSNFDSWPSGSAPSVAEEGRGKVAALLKQQGAAMKGANRSAPVHEEVPPLLEGGGKTEGRIFQGKEPPQFIAIFQPMVVLKGGLSSGYKNYIADKGLNDETYTADGVALIGISGTSQHNNKAVQVEAPGSTIKHTKEGTESSSFWFALGGKQNYTSKKVSPEVVRDPHLFAFSFNKVFVWVGQSVDLKDKQNAFEIGQKYVDLAASLEGLAPNVPLYKVTEGNEPCFFTTYFSWDPAKASEKSNGSNHGGPTQRASALAALNSAFSSSSSPRAASNPRPAGKSQGSQRAAAVAALSSVLTAEKKRSSSVSPARPSRSPRAETSSPVSAKSEGAGEVEHTTEVLKVKETETVEAAPETNGGDSGSKPENDQEENDSESNQTTFSYEQLKAKSDNPVKGIDFKRRETYLSDEEFKSVLGMAKDSFYKLPKWKQDMYKRKVDLF